MSAPYRLQNRRDGVVIRQGRSYIVLTSGEIESLIRNLQQHLDDPKRVEEINGLQEANHR